MWKLNKDKDFARLRSLIFVVFAIVTSVPFLVLLPLVFLPVRYGLPVFKGFIYLQVWLLRTICGLSYSISGRENLTDQPCLFASQHQSSWETVFFHVLLNNPAMIAKSELFTLAVIGRVMRKNGHIPIDRMGTLDSTISSFREAKQRVQKGRSVLIFPTGTRGFAAKQNVKTGVLALYKLLKCPVVPIKLNSGRFVFDNTLLIKPGVIQIDIQPAIAPGLGNAEFFGKLTNALAVDLV
jgi:1-acyl-sn-glycerol-3-phosphate acyltransferase